MPASSSPTRNTSTSTSTSAPTDITDAGTALLSVDGIDKHFSGVQALRDVSFAINAGTIHGLIGPNGAGKTTLFDIITGMTAADAGNCRISGHRLDGTPRDAVARGIARTFQHIRLFNDASVRDNVITGMHSHAQTGLLEALFKTKAQRLETATFARMADDWLDYVGLGGRGNEAASSLPYGDRRRLEIARAMAGNPRLLALDEPAAGMNTTETAQLAELVRRIRADGTTVVLIEHDMQFVMTLCDRVTVLDAGRVIASGEPAMIQRHPEVIAAYLGPSHSDAA